MLRRKTPLRRSPMKRTRMRPSGRKSKYKRRDRDFDFMGWVKTLPCAALEMTHRMTWWFEVTPCDGVVEADHMGSRGLGQKADDRTCVPLCTNHHRERTDHTGMFKHATREQLREWRALAMARTAGRWTSRLLVTSDY